MYANAQNRAEWTADVCCIVSCRPDKVKKQAISSIENRSTNLTERLMIDLDYDGATHEYMHTVRGFGGKPNQGWNAAVYAFWEELVKRGRATTKFFDAAEEKLKSL